MEQEQGTESFLELFDEDVDGLVDHRQRYGVTDKMCECRFFYDLMEKTNDWDEFRWLTSAFLSALRSVTYWLSYHVQNCSQDDEGDYQPDHEAIEKLSPYLKVGAHVIRRRKKAVGVRYYAHPVHPLLVKLNSHRIMTVHFGPLWIKPSKVASPSEFFFKGEGEQVLKFGDEVLGLFGRILGEIGEIGYDPPE